MAAVTGATIITNAQVLCDQDNTVENPPSTWLVWLNMATMELHKYLVSLYSDTWFETIAFTLSGSQYTYNLPDGTLYNGAKAFWAIKGLDYNPGTSSRRSVRQFNFNNRNAITANLNNFTWCMDRYYRVVTKQLLYMGPQENAAGSYLLYYTPGPTLFTSTSDTLMVEMQPYTTFLSASMARIALDKEESDTSSMDQWILQMRQDMADSINNNEAEQTVIADVEGDRQGPWPYAP